MQIRSIQNNSVSGQQNPQFRSVYSAVHWVAETNGSYAPALTNELSKTLNSKLVRVLNTNAREILNKTTRLQHQIALVKKEMETVEDKKLRQKAVKLIEKLEQDLVSLSLMQRIQSFIKRRDIDYAECPYVKTFYNRKGGIKNGKFEPIIYLMTGKDAMCFEEELGKPLGQLKSQAGMEGSAELMRAKTDYWFKGLNFVKNRAKRTCDRNGVRQELHIKTEVERTRTGNIKGYNVVDMGFFPAEGSANPFELTEWAKR